VVAAIQATTTMPMIVAVSEDLTEACVVVVKIEIDLCGLAVYNRINLWQVSMPCVVLNIPSEAGG